MKIAFLTPYLPYPPNTGGKIRSSYLLRGLVRHHTVDLFTVYYGSQPDSEGALGQLCSSVFMTRLCKNSTRFSRLVHLLDSLPKPVDHFQTPESLVEVQNRLQTGRYDLLVADEICMASYVRGISGPKLILRQKVDHLYYRSVAAAQPFGADKFVQWLDAYKLRRYEYRFMSDFNAAVCCSQDDAVVIQSLNPNVPIAVIGNGVDFDYFVASDGNAGPPTLLYVGTMDYYPNIDAIHYFFRKIHPHLLELLPEVLVKVVGHNPPGDILAWQRLRGVEIVGSVPDVRPYLARTTATFVPLRLGSGTRLKILESIAAGRPVVSTTVGAEGLGLRHREHILIADEPEEFARQAADLLVNGDLRQRLVAAGRSFVASLYSWQALGEQFERLCQRVAQNGTL